MRILLLMDPFIPIPPSYYGGIERVIYDIACKYVEIGHEVTLVAGPNSHSPGRLIVYGENTDVQSVKINSRLLMDVATILHQESKHFDVLHNFGRLAWMFPVAWSKIKKVQTYMRYITSHNVKLLNAIGVYRITFTGVSEAIVKTGIAGGGEWKVVYNCAPIAQFTYVPKVKSDAPLVFLGRLERCKGAHTAIEVAKLTGRKLIIAGNISPLKEEREYFEKELKPHFDNRLIEYAGIVNNEEKNKLLGSAAAMLLPVEWYEPFPIVLAESYACGTPILAFSGGGVAEGIFEGSTGLISKTAREMASQVELIPTLSRDKCRTTAVKYFSDTRIASDYLNIYNS